MLRCIIVSVTVGILRFFPALTLNTRLTPVPRRLSRRKSSAAATNARSVCVFICTNLHMRTKINSPSEARDKKACIREFSCARLLVADVVDSWPERISCAAPHTHSRYQQRRQHPDREAYNLTVCPILLGVARGLRFLIMQKKKKQYQPECTLVNSHP